MNKLTIEHLAAYLPYGVKANFTRRMFERNNVDLMGLTIAYNESCKEHFIMKSDVTYGLNHIQLLLRPLSDLTTEIEHNGEKFVPMKELLKIKHKKWFDEHTDSRYSEIVVEDVPSYSKAFFKYMATLEVIIFKGSIFMEEYWIVQKLLSWHFDIYNLIEEGLAIDIKEANNG